MRHHTGDTTIQDPPLQELKKNRQVLKHTCITGCSFLLIILALILVLINVAARSYRKELSHLPAAFPTNIPLYNPEGIEQIIVISGTSNFPLIDYTAAIPKEFLAAIIKKWPRIASSNNISNLEISRPSTREQMTRYILSTVSSTLTYEIIWKKIPTRVEYIADYYRNALDQHGFAVIESEPHKEVRLFTFSDQTIHGTIAIRREMDDPGTTSVILKASLPTTPLLRETPLL